MKMHCAGVVELNKKKLNICFIPKSLKKTF